MTCSTFTPLLPTLAASLHLGFFVVQFLHSINFFFFIDSITRKRPNFLTNTLHIYIHIVAKTREFSENKVLNIIYIDISYMMLIYQFQHRAKTV